MKEVELVKSENGSIDFKYGDIIIPHKECISSYSFWEEMEQAANKAMFRLKKDNPKIGFDFDLSSMMVSKEQRREFVINRITEQFPDVNARLLCDIVDQEVAKITLHADEGANIDNHPNPFGKTTMDSDLVKFVISSVITNYEKQKKSMKEVENNTIEHVSAVGMHFKINTSKPIKHGMWVFAPTWEKDGYSPFFQYDSGIIYANYYSGRFYEITACSINIGLPGIDDKPHEVLSGKSGLDLITFEKERMAFSLKTFTKATALSSLDKCKEEIKEIIEDINKGEKRPEEYADAIMCLFDSAGRNDITMEEIIEAYGKKVTVNVNSEWIDNNNGTYSRIKKSIAN